MDYWLLDEDDAISLYFKLPLYRIDSLVASGTAGAAFTSVSLKTRDGMTELPFEKMADGQIVVSEPNRSLKRYFHPFHFILQVVAALLTLWLVRTMTDAISRLRKGQQTVDVQYVRVFLFCFCGSLLVFGLWLAAFWPGVMSVDSLNIWRAAVSAVCLACQSPVCQ